MSSTKPSLSILVSSYDGLSDCWPVFFHGLRKYWPDCSYRPYLITNHKEFSSEGVSVVSTGSDQGWSRNLLLALERIDTPYLLYFQEDYWLNETVSDSRIREYLGYMSEHGIDYIRLLAFPEPDRDFESDSRLGALASSASYRTSLQPAIWRASVLRDLLVPAESPWEFEINGTERSRRYENSFLSVKAHGTDPYFHGIRYVCTAVNRGRWARAAHAYARQEGIEVDFRNLATETRWHEFLRSPGLGSAISRFLYRSGLLFTNPRLAMQKAMLGAGLLQKGSESTRSEGVSKK